MDQLAELVQSRNELVSLTRVWALCSVSTIGTFRCSIILPSAAGEVCRVDRLTSYSLLYPSEDVSS
jgi:hypothetical protein